MSSPAVDGASLMMMTVLTEDLPNAIRALKKYKFVQPVVKSERTRGRDCSECNPCFDALQTDGDIHISFTFSKEKA